MQKMPRSVNKTQSKWCINKHGASKIIDMFETYQRAEDSTIREAIAWNIWKRRNAIIFNSKDEPLQFVICMCVEDIDLWAQRCSKPASSDSLVSW
jgi:general stress protein 26